MATKDVPLLFLMCIEIQICIHIRGKKQTLVASYVVMKMLGMVEFFYPSLYHLVITLG